MPSHPYYRSSRWQTLREHVLRRDAWRCSIPGCRERATFVDHIVSRRQGGTDTPANLRSLCKLHDHQLKERADGRRGRRTGCGPDGWPYARSETGKGHSETGIGGQHRVPKPRWGS